MQKEINPIIQSKDLQVTILVVGVNVQVFAKICTDLTCMGGVPGKSICCPKRTFELSHCLAENVEAKQIKGSGKMNKR